LDLLPAIHSLQQLINISNEKRPSLSLLISAAHRATRAIGNTLQRNLPPALSSNLPADIRQTLCPLTCYILSSVLPLLSSKRGKQNGIDEDFHVDEFLGIFGNEVLVPLIRSFIPLSRSYAAAILAEGPSTIPIVDIRGDCLHLLTGFISALDGESGIGGSQSTRSLRDCLALEALRQLEALHPDPATAKDTQTVSTRSSRIDRLADKDALSYLCDVLCLVFATSPVPQEVATNSSDTVVPARIDGLLKGAIISSLSGLLRCTGTGSLAYRDECGVGYSDATRRDPIHEGNIVGDVWFNMVLATIERVWVFW
jgi:hypothetical protein